MHTLYLHIGMPKAGSTAIQRFCVQNNETLRGLGYSYPIFKRWNIDTEFKQWNLFNGAFLKWKTIPCEQWRRPNETRIRDILWSIYMSMVIDELRANPNVILSCEHLWRIISACPTEILAPLKEQLEKHGFGIKVLVYLRRQDLHLNAQWVQYLKEGWAAGKKLGWDFNWESYITHAGEFQPLDYHQNLGKIAEIVGKENIIVRVYERERFPDGNIVIDFMDAAGIPRDPKLNWQNIDPNNTKLSHALEVKRIIDSIPGIPYRNRMAFENLYPACAALEDCDKSWSMFSDEEAARLVSKYEETNRLVARDYLGEEGPLFQDTGQGRTKWEPDGRMMAEAAVRYLGLLIAMPKKYRVPWWKCNSNKLRRAITYMRYGWRICLDILEYL